MQVTAAVEETMTFSPASEHDQEWLRQELPGFQESVFRLCLGFARDTHDARDLTQETFVKALAHVRSAAEARDHLRFWLLRIARNTCLDRERRLRVRRLFQTEQPPEAIDWRTPEAEASRNEQILIVRRAIARLPRHLREVLVLRHYGELSYEEIAGILKTGAGTVMSRLSRGRAALIQYYGEEQYGKKS